MKTRWERIYSFFGFWTYYVSSKSGTRRILYWWSKCLHRKFDLFSWKTK